MTLKNHCHWPWLSFKTSKTGLVSCLQISKNKKVFIKNGQSYCINPWRITKQYWPFQTIKNLQWVLKLNHPNTFQCTTFYYYISAANKMILSYWISVRIQSASHRNLLKYAIVWARSFDKNELIKWSFYNLTKSFFPTSLPRSYFSKNFNKSW